MLNKIRFTEIEAVVPQYLSKTFTLNTDGSVTKTTEAHLAYGISTIREMTMEELLEHIKSLTPNCALTYGTPEFDEAYILSARKRQSWVSEPEDLPILGRDNKHFHWNRGAGILMLDHDLDEGQEPFTREQFLQAMYTVWPALETLPHIWAPSASSCVCYPDGSIYRPLTSQRLLVPLAKGFDVPRLLKILTIKLWLNNHGFIRLSKSGTQLVRSIIDVCTAQPSRLDFIGGAHCLGALFQTRKELITGYNLNNRFAIREDYPKLTGDERQEYQKIVQRKKRRTAREARRIRDIWVRERVEESLSKYPEEERERRREKLQRVYGHAAEAEELTGDFVLWCHTFQKHVTVQQILENVDRYNGAEFADPIEPDIEDKRVAVANLRRNPPALYSHLHGGTEYVLKIEKGKFTPRPEAENKILGHLNNDNYQNKLILVTPGVGKTHLAEKDAIRRAEDGIVIYAQVNHNKINEDFPRLQPPEHIKLYHYYGRWWETKIGNTSKEGKAKNCDPQQFKRIEEVGAYGYSPTACVCTSCEHSPWNAKRNRRKPCRYWRQLEGLTATSSAVIFCTTLGLASLLDHLSNEKLEVQHIYIDEQAASAMISSIKPLTSDSLETVRGALGSETFQIVQRITREASSMARIVRDEGLRCAKFYVHPYEDESSLKDELDLADDAINTLHEELKKILKLKASERNDFYYKGVNWNAIRWLHTFCQPKSTKNAWLSVDTQDTSGHIKFHLSEIRRLPKNCKLTILDATGELDENERLFDRKFETLEVRVGWKGTGIWVRKKRSKTVLLGMSDEQIRRELEEDFLPYVPADARTGFLATIAAIEKRVLKILKKLTPAITWKSTHFWGARGLNNFEDCELGLVYGFSYKNVGALEDDARTIFGPDKLRRTRWCNAQNHQEHYQTDERLRLIRNPGRLLVVIGPLYPVEHLGRPQEEFDMRQAGEYTDAELAAERILDVFSKTGIHACSKRYAWLLNICHASETERMAKHREHVWNNISEQKNPCSGLNACKSSILKQLLAYNIYYKPFTVLEGTESLESIINPDDKFWNNVWSEILARKPALGKLEVKHDEVNKRNYSHGVGSIEDGERLDQLFEGCGLRPGIWRVRE